MFPMVIFNPEVIESEHLYQKFTVGGNGGVIFRYCGNKYCGFQIELDYLQRGWREKGSDSIGEVDYKRHLHYIELPFLTHIYIGNSRGKFMFNLGPQVGVCLYDVSSGRKQVSITHQYAKIPHTIDWGVLAGMGMIYQTSNFHQLELEFRFSYSFGPLFDNRVTSFFSSSNPITLSANLCWMWHVESKKRNKITVGGGSL